MITQENGRWVLIDGEKVVRAAHPAEIPGAPVSQQRDLGVQASLNAAMVTDLGDLKRAISEVKEALVARLDEKFSPSFLEEAVVVEDRTPQELEGIKKELDHIRQALSNLPAPQPLPEFPEFPPFPEIPAPPNFNLEFAQIDEKFVKLENSIFGELRALSNAVKNMPPVTVITEDKTVQVTTHNVDLTELLNRLDTQQKTINELAFNLGHLHFEFDNFSKPKPSFWQRLKNWGMKWLT